MKLTKAESVLLSASLCGGFTMREEMKVQLRKISNLEYYRVLTVLGNKSRSSNTGEKHTINLSHSKPTIAFFVNGHIYREPTVIDRADFQSQFLLSLMDDFYNEVPLVQDGDLTEKASSSSKKKANRKNKKVVKTELGSEA